MVPNEQWIPLILTYVFCGLFLILFYFVITAYFFKLCRTLFWQMSESVFLTEDPEIKDPEALDQQKIISNEAVSKEKDVNPV